MDFMRISETAQAAMKLALENETTETPETDDADTLFDAVTVSDMWSDTNKEGVSSMEWIHMSLTEKVKATATTARKLARNLDDIVKESDAARKATFVAMQKEASKVASNLDAMGILAGNPQLAAMAIASQKVSD